MSESKHTRKELAELQALPLSLKVRLTQQRIREWVNHYGVDGVAVSFSGGKDSTVLLHIVREMYGDSIPGVFCDTGLEYPEIRSFVRTFDNIVWLKPKKNFRQVITEYGYPFISKEVSECVYGARKYLTEVLAEVVPVDRQTDRQTDRQIPYRYWYDRVTGTGAYQKPQTRDAAQVPVRNGKSSWILPTGNPSADYRGGGYDNKYRKLRGIGEYVKQTDGKPRRGKQSETGNHVGDADKGQGASDKGEYP